MRSLALTLAVCGVLLPSPVGAQIVGRTFVYVADGAGDGTTASDRLGALIAERRLPLTVVRVPWCRTGMLALDYNDSQAQLAAAAQLARYAQAARDRGNRIIFLGHSAGARVVLAAAEMMPPGSVERVVLLSSAVSATYDVRVALRATTGGIDNFYSPYDAMLAQTTDMGTAEGPPGEAAGQVGLRLPPGVPGVEYARVRQLRWTERMCGQGGHYVWTATPNLRDYVVPALLAP